MPTINQLPSIDEVSGGNQIPTYYAGGGDARKMSVNLLQDYLQDNLDFPDNASEITYNPAGTSAVARTVESKLRDVVSVKDFGAVGNGVADDTAAIQAAVSAVKSLGGGTIFFPRGTYKVVFPAGLAAYSSLFPLASNTTIQFDKGASISASAVPGSLLFAAVFGPDKTALPVKNLRFQDLRITQSAAGGGEELAAAINLDAPSDAAANRVTNVVIDGCYFENFGSAIYIIQRTSAGQTTRQVNGVKITDCTLVGNYSGITADGEDIQIIGNTIFGSSSAPASYFDGVSIHSGKNVRVVGNNISYYGEFGVNLRNSPNNFSGSYDVVISNNTLSECPKKAIGVYVVSGESTQGVKRIAVTGNTILNSTSGNTCTGILVTSGTATAGTPFEKISVSSNIIDNCNSGLEINANSTVNLLYLTLSNNNVYGRTTCAEAQLRINYTVLSTVNGNTINGENTGASYQSVVISNTSYTSIAGNEFYSGSGYSETLSFFSLTEVSFTGNYCYGKYLFNSISTTCVIGQNRFTSSGVCESRPLVGTWSLTQSRIESFGAVPTTGTWKIGDRVYVDAPAAGGYIGSVCTTAGTPGTWKTFGAITA